MPPRKRAASDALDAPRRSRRISSTVTKSSYFEDDDTGESEDDSPVYKSHNGVGKPKATPRRRGKAQVKAVEDEESDDYQDENGEEEEEEEAEDDDKEDNDAEDEVNEDELNLDVRVSTVKVIKMRPVGAVEYADERLHPNTKLFLKDLKAHNKRAWLKENDKEYRRAWKDWESFVESFTARLSSLDFTIPELPTRDVIFRIYRDTRFSKDPTPYKPHFSAAWSRTGRKGPYACYYIHAEPGSCFVGGGLWHPDNDALRLLRANIDERPRRWRRVLSDPDFVRVFLPGTKPGEEAALKAFAKKNGENALKTRPKGFNPEHRDLELLKLRNFTVGTKISDDHLFGPDAQDEIIETMGIMVRFVNFLNTIVMPDPNLSDNESDSEEVEEEEE